MKKLLKISGLLLSFILLNSCVKAETSFHEDARCTGSASCSACSNCSRCAHCSSGGTCGVCRGSSSGRRFYSVPKKHKTSYSSTAHKKSSTRKKSSYAANSVKSNPVAVNFYGSEKLKTDVVSITKTTNVHKKPSLKAPVIQKISKGSAVKILENRNHWKKIKVIKSGNVGFVYSQHLN